MRGTEDTEALFLVAAVPRCERGPIRLPRLLLDPESPAKILHLVFVEPKQASGLHSHPLGFLERRLNPTPFEGFHLFIQPDAGVREAKSIG